GNEVIVVDGGSTDGTAELAAPWADLVVIAPRGRARQMNAGAQNAFGSILLFLHADSVLPPEADALIVDGLNRTRRSWGRFDARLPAAGAGGGAAHDPALEVDRHRDRRSGHLRPPVVVYRRRRLS